MKGTRLIGAVLLALGILALAYRGFTYTKETHEAKVGPIEVEFQEKERVEIPVWAGVLVAVTGGVLLFVGDKRRRK